MSQKRCKICVQYACFGNQAGWCDVLDDTHWPQDTLCPFYKTKAEAAADREKANRRLKEIYGTTDYAKIFGK